MLGYCIAHQLYIGLLMIRTCRVVTLVVRGLEMSPANHTYLVGHPAISTYRNQPLFSNSRILGKCVSSAIVAERYTATCIRHFDSFLLLQLTDRASLCKQTTATPARTASYVAPLATEIVDNAAHSASDETWAPHSPERMPRLRQDTENYYFYTSLFSTHTVSK